VDVSGDICDSLLEQQQQQHLEQLMTAKKARKPPKEAIYHISDHGSTSRLFPERKRIGVKGHSRCLMLELAPNCFLKESEPGLKVIPDASCWNWLQIVS
jgi:hypothetical protein